MSEEKVLELRINQFTEFSSYGSTQQRLSEPIYIQGLPWTISVKPELIGDRYSRESVLQFVLQSDGGDNNYWTCRATATFHIVSQKENVTDIIRQIVLYFSHEYNLGYSKIGRSYVPSDVLRDPDNGFIRDDTLILRAHVKINNMLKEQLPYFVSTIAVPPDGVLIVENQRIPIHKTYLSCYSDFFKTMFQSEFKEGSEDEIVLEEVKYDEMRELLAVIYPSIAPITSSNIKTMLKLADRFIMPSVVDRCKKELRTSTVITGTQKLLLAQRYNFPDLLMEFAQQCRTVDDAKKVKSAPEYTLLNCNTRALLFDSISS